MIKKILLFILGLCAVAVELLAVNTLIQPLSNHNPLLIFLLFQGLASFLMALFASEILAARYKKSQGSIFSYVFALCFFIPLGGHIIIFVLLALGGFQLSRSPSDSKQITQPNFLPELITKVTHGSGARLRAQLENSEEPEANRLVAMTALRLFPTNITDHLLRKLLADSCEEVRLLAFGVIDATEKKIMNQIFLVLEELKDAVTVTEKTTFNSQLAELYWELIYQCSVTGEVYRYTLERAEYYAHETLALNSKDATMWYLLGRCALLKKQPEQAEHYLQQAQYYLFPNERLTPWLAEAAFLQKKYAEVGRLLFAFKKSTTPTSLQPCVHYWSL